MPITSERMTALIRAARAYQSKEIHLGQLIQTYFDHWTNEIIPRFNALDTTPETESLFQDIQEGINNILYQIQKPILTEHISAIAQEEGHFQARANANAASKRYMQRSRKRKQNAANWPDQSSIPPTRTAEVDIILEDEEEYVSQNPNPMPTTFNIGGKKE